MSEKFTSTLVNADFGLADITCTAGEPVKIGERKIEAGEEISMGQGVYDDRERAIGRIYMKFQDVTPAEVPGLVRISIWSPQNRPKRILKEYRTSKLSNATEMQSREPLNESAYALQEDQKLVVEFIADTTTEIIAANSTIELDVTVFEV